MSSNYRWLDIGGLQCPTHNRRDNCTYIHLSCSHKSESTCREFCTHPRLQHSGTTIRLLSATTTHKAKQINKCMAISNVMAARWVGQNSRSIFSHLWTKVHKLSLPVQEYP